MKTDSNLVLQAAPEPTRPLRSGRYRLDNLEKAILSLLCKDGRMAYQTIARELAVDEKTVRNRIAKLREGGILNFIPAANPNEMRGCIVAIIAVCTDTNVRNDVHRLADELASLPMVSWVGAVMGQYDLMLEVVVDSWEELVQFELEELPAVQGVGRTDSFLVLSHYGKRGVPFVENILQPK